MVGLGGGGQEGYGGAPWRAGGGGAERSRTQRRRGADGSMRQQRDRRGGFGARERGRGRGRGSSGAGGGWTRWRAGGRYCRRSPGLAEKGRSGDLQERRVQYLRVAAVGGEQEEGVGSKERGARRKKDAVRGGGRFLSIRRGSGRHCQRRCGWMLNTVWYWEQISNITSKQLIFNASNANSEVQTLIFTSKRAVTIIAEKAQSILRMDGYMYN